MIPPFIISEAANRGITLIAITDHNSSANVSAVQKAAAGSGVTVLPGMELQTREEVHVLCLFNNLDQLSAWQVIVDKTLPPLENRVDFFGEQFVVDETGDFIRRETRLLLTSSSLSFDDSCSKVHALGGLFIPAHVDRKAFGLFAALGFVPDNAAVDALELSRHTPLYKAAQQYPQITGFPLVQDGDAHRLNEFLGTNELWIEEPTLAEIHLALQHNAGRKLISRPVPS